MTIQVLIYLSGFRNTKIVYKGFVIPGPDIYYTLNGSMLADCALKYAQQVEIPDSPVTLRAITYTKRKRSVI